MTDEVRVQAVLQRAEELREQRFRMVNRALAAASAVVGTLTLFMIVVLSGGRESPAGTEYYGTSPLFEGAGGYVLVAVLAFTAAVAVTLLSIRYREKKVRGEHRRNGGAEAALKDEREADTR